MRYRKLFQVFSIFAAMVVLPGGCATLRVSSKQVTVGGVGHYKTITYVGASCGDGLLGGISVCDRYGADGSLIAHDSSVNQGLLESALAGAFTGAAGAIKFGVKYPPRASRTLG